MHSQVRIMPQLLLNGNCLNEGDSMHIITAVCKFIDESKCLGNKLSNYSSNYVFLMYCNFSNIISTFVKQAIYALICMMFCM